MRCEIQMKTGYGYWDPSAAGNTHNEFDSEDEAKDAIEDLKKIGEEWADAEYRVRPIPA